MTGCSFSDEHKLIYFPVSSAISILYFTIYIIITIFVSVYATLHNSSLYIDSKHVQNLSFIDKCKPYLKCYVFLLLHFAIQSINIGIIIQYYYIASTRDCDHNIPESSLNINILTTASLGVLMIYRIITAFKIYSITHNIFHCFIQFLFDFCIIKSLFVELTKYQYIGHRKHYVHICHCFQWFLRIQAFYNAAPMAFIQLVAVLLYFSFAHPLDANTYYIPILLSLFLCIINVIAISFESDSIVFNPHLFNVCKIWLIRLIFRILDISLRLISLALCWVMIGGYFVVLITCCELLYIFIACARLQLMHKGVLRRNASILSPSSQPKNHSKSSLSKRATVRISNEYAQREYIYRPNSIGRLIIGDMNQANDALGFETTHDAETPNGKENMSSIRCLFGRIILRTFDYYIHGICIILISFRFEDRSSCFSIWFWRFRVICNISIMSLITVFGYAHIWCPYFCFHGAPYHVSFIEPNADDYHIGFILFVYAWFACIALPIVFIYLAIGKIKTDRYSPKCLDDVMINGDIIGIFELDIFGVFHSKTDENMLRQSVYTLTACNLNWMELNNDILMQYLHILCSVNINFNEVYDPYDCHNTLINQLCQNQKDCYQWFKMKEITDLLHNESTEIIRSCCSSGNFRIFKHIIKHFGYQYLKNNAFASLHYAFRCQGTKLQQQQASRIIVYVLKNSAMNLQQFIESYDNEREQIVMKRMIKMKYADIQQIQRDTNNQMEKATFDGDRAILLQRQLSNNSIVTLDSHSIEADLDSSHYMD